MKARQIGSISFTEEGYEQFTSLPKDKQLEKVYNNLSPKDMDKAKKLLTHIPHGDISSGNEQEATEDNTANATGGSNKAGAKRRKPGTEESQD